MERDPMELVVSNDLVMDIVLSHLKVIDLLSCRLTSKFWNKAASSLLRKRSTMIKKISSKKRLMELDECMQTSSDFPFAGLKFDKPWTQNFGGAAKFFEDYGARFTRLCLDTHCTGRLDVMVPFIHHLSRLSVLEMALPHSRPPHSRLQLLDTNAELDDDKILDLSSLRTLRIFCPKVTNEVLRQVLIATSPSIKIECLNTTPRIFGALKKAGKLRAVTFVKFNHPGKQQYRSQMNQLLSTKSPRLTKLDFSVNGCLSMDGLTKVLFSSRRTLKELHFDAQDMGSELGDLWNDFPVLAKLTKLSLRIKIDSCLRYLFQGRRGRKFPALKEFRLVAGYSYKDPAASYSNCLFIVPSVTRIDLRGYVNEHAMEKLAQVFPNVTDIRLESGDYCSNSVSSDQSEIWGVGAFKSLERLRIWNYRVKQPGKDITSMDSFLTGMPAVICDSLRNRERLNLIDSPWNEISRTNPSILRLKNLKELTICVKLTHELKKLLKGPPFMSILSMWYALEMIPNLRTTFTYEVNLPRSSVQEEYISALEAALKHVRPYVTLEPFFY